MLEQGMVRSDMSIRNNSLQLQGQTGGDELQSGGPGVDSGPRTEG